MNGNTFTCISKGPPPFPFIRESMRILARRSPFLLRAHLCSSGRICMKIWNGGVSYALMKAASWYIDSSPVYCAPLKLLLFLLPPPQQQFYVKQGISYMQNHLSDNFSIENLAEMLGVSSSYFNRLFVKEMGMTPLGYLNNLRISHAAFLLSDTLLSVDEVAKKCGFSCGNYFCKVFRRALGYSPSEFRRRSENLDQEKDLKGATPLC